MSSIHKQMEPPDTPQDTDQKPLQAPDDLTGFRSVWHHNPGNGMRLDSPFGICLDERWWSVLTEQDIAVLDSVVITMGGRYGYV